MGRITSLFARKVVRQGEAGIDGDALLRTVGLERGSVIDPSFMIKDEDYYRLFEMAAAADPDATTLPLRVRSAAVGR